MTLTNFIYKVKSKLKNIIGYWIFQYPRVLKDKFLSDNKNIIGSPKCNQPTQLLGGVQSCLVKM